MASTIGAWSYVKNDGSLSTKDDVNSNLSSTGKNKSTTNKTTLDVEQFLQLMVAEMQNQDPLEPTDNSDYMAQLATFTQVEATKEMNDNTLQDMASNLVGKQVIMTTTQNSNGYIGGTVDYWETINGTVYLGIGGKLYDIADLDTVMDKDYFDKWKGNGSTTDTKTEDTKPGEWRRTGYHDQSASQQKSIEGISDHDVLPVLHVMGCSFLLPGCIPEPG